MVKKYTCRISKLQNQMPKKENEAILVSILEDINNCKRIKMIWWLQTENNQG